jgi:hypothetical protein
MSETKIGANARYLFRGDTAENWEKAGNPTLAEREPGLLLDENRCFVGLKIGDGKTPWNELPLHKFGEAEKNYNPKSENAQSGIAVAEAIKDKPNLYTGTEILTDIEDIVEIGFTDIPERWATLKLGDFYYNTEVQKTYQCIGVDFTDNQLRAKFKALSGSSSAVDQTYKPSSPNAQSGKAVAEAVIQKANFEMTSYEGSNMTPTATNPIDSHKGNWKVFFVDDVNEYGVFRLHYGLGNTMMNTISVSRDVITPDKLPNGTKININGSGSWLIISLIKDVEDKADKSVIGDIDKALDKIKELQESILGGE